MDFRLRHHPHLRIEFRVVVNRKSVVHGWDLIVRKQHDGQVVGIWNVRKGNVAHFGHDCRITSLQSTRALASGSTWDARRSSTTSEEEGRDATAIASLYPDCTVMFAGKQKLAGPQGR